MICRNYEWIFSGTFLTTLYDKCLQSTNARKFSYRLHCHFLVYDSNVYAVVCSLFTRFTAYTFLATIN